MAATGSVTITDVGGAAAAVFAFTLKHKQVAVTNYHATQTLFVRPAVGLTQAAATATATANPAVTTGADFNYTVPFGKRVTIFKSSRKQFVAMSMIASGAATSFTAEGTDWQD